jgi:hypothetical protein
VHCHINAADPIHGPRKMAHALGWTKTSTTASNSLRVWLPTPARFKCLTGHGPRFTVGLGRPAVGGAGLDSLCKKPDRREFTRWKPDNLTWCKPDRQKKARTMAGRSEWGGRFRIQNRKINPCLFLRTVENLHHPMP